MDGNTDSKLTPAQRVMMVLTEQRNIAMSQLATVQAELGALREALDEANKQIADYEAGADAG